MHISKRRLTVVANSSKVKCLSNIAIIFFNGNIGQNRSVSKSNRHVLRFWLALSTVMNITPVKKTLLNGKIWKHNILAYFLKCLSRVGNWIVFFIRMVKLGAFNNFGPDLLITTTCVVTEHKMIPYVMSTFSCSIGHQACAKHILLSLSHLPLRNPSRKKSIILFNEGAVKVESIFAVYIMLLKNSCF